MKKADNCVGPFPGVNGLIDEVIHLIELNFAIKQLSIIKFHILVVEALPYTPKIPHFRGVMK